MLRIGVTLTFGNKDSVTLRECSLSGYLETTISKTSAWKPETQVILEIAVRQRFIDCVMRAM